MITTPIIEENHFFNKEKLGDDISGNDYKEVVNQNPREWILKTSDKPQQTEAKAILTLDDALKEVEKEKEKTKEYLNAGLDGGEMTAKGRKKKGKSKGKTKNKKERARNGQLHEVKALTKNTKNTQKWNGKKEQVKNIQPMSSLKNKEITKN